MTDTTRVDWALHAASRGWPVFPVAPGAKQPAIRDWEHRATTDPTSITAFWTTHPRHNIGIACGPAGLAVVDLDITKRGQTPPEDGSITRGVVCGAQVLGRLARQDSQTVPDTWTVRTPSGGTHLYFRAPQGTRLHNTHHTLGWLIDTRAWGGQVVAPGSGTPDGDYELISDMPPAELPGWLCQRLADKPPTATSAPHTIASPNITRWVAAAIAGETERVRTAPPGTHNLAQQKAARALGELVGAHVLDYHDAQRVMEQAAQPHITGPCGCTQRGVTRVIESALRYGMDNPRDIHPHNTRIAA